VVEKPGRDQSPALPGGAVSGPVSSVGFALLRLPMLRPTNKPDTVIHVAVILFLFSIILVRVQ